jgi:hypothetical protein
MSGGYRKRQQCGECTRERVAWVEDRRAVTYEKTLMVAGDSRLGVSAVQEVAGKLELVPHDNRHDPIRISDALMCTITRCKCEPGTLRVYPAREVKRAFNEAVRRDKRTFRLQGFPVPDAPETADLVLRTLRADRPVNGAGERRGRARQPR